jgi:integrase/recombinase XerD
MTTLRTHLENYLKLRRGLGFKLRVTGILLSGFVRFAERRRASFISTKLALEWATRLSHIQPTQKARRLAVVRRFASYLSASEPRTEVPPKRLLGCQSRRRQPFLYRPEDIARLMEVAGQIYGDSPLKATTLATVIGLMAVTGMRVGEVIGLDRSDVDLTQGLITVRRAKGDRSRLLPLDASSQLALEQYATLRDQTFPRRDCSSFFLSARGNQLVYGTVHRNFLSVVRQVGLAKPGEQRRPRLHDLRHHFCIETMLRWYRTAEDVDARLPELSTYLGHGHVEGTYWYLSAVPELLQLATQRWQGKEDRR